MSFLSNKAALTALTMGAIGLGSINAAHAQVMFAAGNNPQAGQENIVLDNGLSGFSLSGTTNQSNTVVLFGSTEQINSQSNGQTQISAKDGSLNNLTFSIPGDTFTGLIFDARLPEGPNSTLSLTVNSSYGTQIGSLVLGTGSNFETISAQPGTTINSVTLSSPSGFTDLEQIRVSGLSPVGGVNPNGAGVPEPGSVALLMGMGVTGTLFAASRLRRRRK